MESDKLNLKFFSYYTEAGELIGKPTLQVLTQILYVLHRQKKDKLFLSLKDLCTYTSISKNTILSVLDDVQRLNLISYSKQGKGIEITFNADYFASLMSAFTKLSKPQDREEYRTAFMNCDTKSLYKLGYEFIPESGKIGVGAEKIKFAEKSPNFGTFLNESEENSEKSPKIGRLLCCENKKSPKTGTFLDSEDKKSPNFGRFLEDNTNGDKKSPSFGTFFEGKIERKVIN